MNQKYIDISHADLVIEFSQCKDEGRNLDSVANDFTELLKADLEEPENQLRALNLLDKTILLPIVSDYPYLEPSDLEAIRAARPQPSVMIPANTLTELKMLDRLHGAWAGRSAGCLLGKPIELWRSPRLWGLLKETGKFPLRDYLRLDDFPIDIQAKYEMVERPDWADRIDGMPEDDDLNYTTTGLAIFKQYGQKFTSENVAQFWQSNIPILHTFTAERVAMRNLKSGAIPPATALLRNPYREWIGAQIRADFWGYVAPGNPELAAEYAWRDASVSHVKNGIYGAMWAAAMISSAFILTDPREIIQAGIDQIPEKCRLADYLESILEWHEIEVDYDTCIRRVHEMFDEKTDHHWCHTIPNAMIVALALLFGKGDFELSICRAVQPCFDTDCNGATVGSIFGAIHGLSALPQKWIEPLNDTLTTGVIGYEKVTLEQMALLTRKLQP